MGRFLLKIWMLLAFIVVSSGSYASTVNVKANNAPQAVNSISAICNTSPFNCLANVDHAISQAPENGRIYFEILQYKYEALLNLQYMDRLYQETKVWLNKSELPVLFQISNAIYFAKAALRMNNKKESIESYQFAKSLLRQMNEQYPSPLRLVQFANLQMQLNEFQAAYDLLMSLKLKYVKSPDVHFMLELNGNLGHAANQLGLQDKALVHWQDSVKWAELLGNKQQIAVVLFNLADIYDQLQQYSQAEKTFVRAAKIAFEAGDEVKSNQAKYHLVRVFARQQKYCQAQKLYRIIDVKSLPNKKIYPFDDLTEMLAQCREH